MFQNKTNLPKLILLPFSNFFFSNIKIIIFILLISRCHRVVLILDLSCWPFYCFSINKIIFSLTADNNTVINFNGFLIDNRNSIKDNNQSILPCGIK